MDIDCFIDNLFCFSPAVFQEHSSAPVSGVSSLPWMASRCQKTCWMDRACFNQLEDHGHWWDGWYSIVFEAEHDKTYKMTGVPDKDPDQPGHLPSQIRALLSSWRRFASLGSHKVHCKDSDQTMCMHRLIWVFAACTYHYSPALKKWGLYWICPVLP